MRLVFRSFRRGLRQRWRLREPIVTRLVYLISLSLLCSCIEPDKSESMPDSVVMIQSTFDAEIEPDAILDATVTLLDASEDVSPDLAVIDQELDRDLPMDMAVDLGPSSGPYTTAQVDDIFQRGCGSCHNSTASPPLGGGVSAWINRGSGQSPLPLIVPGNHQRSYLYHKLADTHRDPPSNGRGTGMPMGRQLYSESRLERIAGWIDNL